MILLLLLLLITIVQLRPTTLTSKSFTRRKKKMLSSFTPHTFVRSAAGIHFTNLIFYLIFRKFIRAHVLHLVEISCVQENELSSWANWTNLGQENKLKYHFARLNLHLPNATACFSNHLLIFSISFEIHPNQTCLFAIFFFFFTSSFFFFTHGLSIFFFIFFS
jgi:hypothetical protein